MVYTRGRDTMSEGKKMAAMASASGSSRNSGGADTSPIILLHPFDHQVGGHTRMLLLDPSTICKALIARELNFYLNIPKEIRDFTPNFKGVIQVSTIDNTNVVQLKNMPTTGQSTSRSSSVSMLDSDGESKSKKTKWSSNKETIRVKLCSEGNLMLDLGSYGKDSSSSSRYFDEYWFKTHKQSNVQYFLLLENVAFHFYRPCVLDLKMGTRQHGDDAPEEKRHSHIAKCKASTSGNLGVRLCGMQVYQADTATYIWKDKYCGRTLDEEGFKQALFQFFHNGFKLRVRVIKQIIEHLQRLRKAVEKQNSFRFYSSSLLVTYEGCDTKEDEEEEEIGMMSSDDPCTDSESEGAYGYVRSSLYGSLPPTSSYRTQSDCENTDSVLESSSEMDVCGRDPAGPSQPLLLTRNGGIGKNEGIREHQTQVDVRMIDFAHTTHEGYVGDSLVHRGPDNGYILGLDNMIRLLMDIIAEGEHDKE